MVELEGSKVVSPLIQAVGYMKEFAYIDTYVDRYFLTSCSFIFRSLIMRSIASYELIFLLTTIDGISPDKDHPRQGGGLSGKVALKLL